MYACKYKYNEFIYLKRSSAQSKEELKYPIKKSKRKMNNEIFCNFVENCIIEKFHIFMSINYKYNT